MSSDNLQTLLDATAGDLVTADYDSAQDVIALCSRIEKLRDATTAAGHMRIPNALSRVLALINCIVTDETCDRTAALDTLNKLFSAIQYALRPGSDPEKLRVPAGTMSDAAAYAGGAGLPSGKDYTLPDYLDRELFREFINDQESVLSHLEEQLLRLEYSPDGESLGDIRRLFHTLKGEAGVFELRQVERLCHTAEDLIDSQPEHIPVDMLLTVKDWLKNCFDALKLERPVPPFTADIFSLLFHSPDGAVAVSPGVEFDIGLPLSDTAQKFELSPFIAPELFAIFIEEQSNALKKMETMILRLENGPDLEAIAALKCIFHTMNGGSGVCGLTDVERVCCHIEDAIEKNPEFLSPESLLEIKHWLRNVFDALKAEQPLPVLADALLERFALPATWLYSGMPESANQSADTFFDEAIFNDFVDEQQSVGARIEDLVLRFEKQPDSEIMDELKRIFHTLKGEARVFGLFDIEKLCHTVEDLLEAHGKTLRIDALFSVKDFLARCFNALKNHAPLPKLTPEMLGALTLSCSDEYSDSSIIAAVVNNPLKGPVEFRVEPPPVTSGPESADADSGAARTLLTADLDLLYDFVSEVKEHIDNINDRLLTLENNPGDSDLLNAVFRVFHTIKGAAGFLALDEISRLSHITESLLDSARKGDLLLKGGSIDVVFEAVDEMKNLVGTIEAGISSGENSYPPSRTVDFLIEKIKRILNPHSSDASCNPVISDRAEADSAIQTCASKTFEIRSNDTVSLINQQIKPAMINSSAGESDPNVSRAEPAENAADSDADEFLEILYDNDEEITQKNQISDVRQSSHPNKAKIKESIKVDAENLDKLIDAIGELVIIEAMIRQDPTIRVGASSTLLRNITQMDKITRELQTLGMSMRMIPIKATFQKMARVVRDLARKSDKKIEFITKGEDTMLDKSVVDRIGDPLIHLVRNAVDHGIEATHDDRRRAGKNSVGRIILTAFHKGGNIYVEINDDGRGLNRAAIQSKAIEKGLIREGHLLSDREIYSMVLLPGFSTARKVTDVSGRGVGMDVVKRTIDDLRGNIDITSEPGKGTTISMRLPLTLAIIDGMLVRIGNERYIIPTLSIVESIRPRTQDITTVVNKGEMVIIRDRLIPLFRLADLFHIKGTQQKIEDSIVIVVEDSGRMTGIMVDELLGQQSTVIKSLGALKGLTGISGGSIMTDGSVGIILDISGIVKLATGE
jgi:two-component system, chemotaxis family, sensor kinase CheA